MAEHYHKVCKMVEIKEVIHIECKNHIDNLKDQRTHDIYDCECSTKEIKRMVCLDCQSIEHRLISLEEAFDDAMFWMRKTIKQDVSKLLDKISQISIEMRHCERLLAEKR
jgi:predicted RNA-binding protein with PUA-like domain